MTYRVEPLDEGHELDGFECGNAELDDWLKRHALNARGQGTRTYVLLDERSRRVEGYFAIAPHMVTRDEIPPRVGRGAPKQIPAILLAKLALDRRLHGRGQGVDLLVRALETIVQAGRAAGGKVVVVDAIDESAKAFYMRFDFDPVPDDPRRLVMKLSTAAKALGLAWP